jgi:hypothetical protein
MPERGAAPRRPSRTAKTRRRDNLAREAVIEIVQQCKATTARANAQYLRKHADEILAREAVVEIALQCKATKARVSVHYST